MTVLRRRSQLPEADKNGSNNGSAIYEEHKTPMLFLFLYNNIFVVYKYLINVNIVTFVPHPSPSPFALYREAHGHGELSLTLPCLALFFAQITLPADYWWSDLLNRAWGVHLPINKGIIAIIISLAVQISCLFITNGTPYIFPFYNNNWLDS